MREELLTRVLDKLVNEKRPITSNELAFSLDVSEKTALKYLNILKQELKDKGASIEIKQGAGSYLKINDADSFASYYHSLKAQTDIFSDPDVRKDYVLMRLLTTDDYLNIYEFADELYISPSLLRGIIKSLKPIIEEYNLVYDHSHNHGYRIKGDEKNIRRCLTVECKNADTLKHCLESSELKTNELTQIKRVIFEALEKYGIAISNEGVNSLALHILVAINRIETNNTIEFDDMYFVNQLKGSPEYFVASYINKMLQPYINQQLPEVELLYLTMHINGKQRIVHREKLQVKIGQDTLVFYNKFLRNIYQRTNVDFFDNQELRTSLLNHIVPFLNRINNNLQIKESELINVRNEFPYAYELALIGMEVLTKQGIQVSTIEISYFALHLALALEKMKNDDVKSNILVILKEYSSLTYIISYKLEKEFTDDINLIKFITKDELTNFDFSDYQIVLNMTEAALINNVEYLNVSTSLDYDDLHQIKTAINAVALKMNIYSFFNPNLFYFVEGETKDEVLANMIKKVQKTIDLPPNFITQVNAREEIESTECANKLAIPHPLNITNMPSFVAIGILKKPIIWNSKQVQLIFLSCVQSDMKTSQALFDVISKIVRDENLSQALIQAKDSKEFDSILKSCR